MAIYLTLSYFFAKHYIFMAHNNEPMTSTQVEGIQGNTLGAIPMESYFLQIHNFLKSTLNEIIEFWQSHGTLEAHLISMQCNTNRPKEHQGEHL